MSINRSFWFNTLAEWESIHPADIQSNGTGESFQLNDVVFVYDDSGELLIYILTAFDDAEVGDPPYIVLGTEEPDRERGVWFLLNLAYTTNLISFIDESVASCADSENSVEVCELLDDIRNDPKLLFYESRSEAAAGTATTTWNLNDTTENDWTEEVAAELDWTTGGLAADSSGTPPVTIHLMNSTQFSDYYNENSHYYGVNADPTLIAVVNNILGHAKVYKLNESTGAYTLHSSIVVPFSGTTIQGDCDIVSVTGNRIAIGDPDYTGSKTNEGRVLIYSFNADGTFDAGSLVIVTAPVPTRNGNMGKVVGFGNVTDGTYGADFHLIVPVLDEIWYLRESNSFATIHILTALDRNDVCEFIITGNNKHVYCYYDDSVGNIRLAYKPYNGSSYNVLTETALARTFGPHGGGFFDDNVFMFVAKSSNIYVKRFDGNSIIHTGSYPYSSYGGGCRGKCTCYGYYYFATWRYIAPNYYLGANRYNPTTLNVTMQVHFIMTPVVYTFTPFAYAKANGDCYILAPRSSSGTLYDVYMGNAGDDVSYAEGSWHFYSNSAASKYVVGENVSGIDSALITQTGLPQNAELLFAWSLDDGVTWWAKPDGSTLTQLSSVADVETQGGYYGWFSQHMSELEITPGMTISFAFAFIRPATVSPTLSFKVEKFAITFDSSDINTRVTDYTAFQIGLADNRVAAGRYNVDAPFDHKTFIAYFELFK